MALPVAGSPCVCGGRFANGLRYSTADGPVAVVVCLAPDGSGCGREYPPQGACCSRPADARGAHRTYCRHCLGGFATDDARARYCSARCEARAGALAGSLEGIA